jgi:hypothetical protein
LFVRLEALEIFFHLNLRRAVSVWRSDLVLFLVVAQGAAKEGTIRLLLFIAWTDQD